MSVCVHPMHAGVPSGADIQQLLTDLERAENKVDELLKHWKDLLADKLNTANSFQHDHKSVQLLICTDFPNSLTFYFPLDYACLE